MPLPEVDDETGNLPEGDHIATWDELSERFGVDPRRKRHLRNLRVVLDDLVWPRGVEKVWIDGSFISLQRFRESARPRDIDVCYAADPNNDPLNWNNRSHLELKQRRKVDLLPHYWLTSSVDPTPIIDSFRRDDFGRTRGIVVLMNGS